MGLLGTETTPEARGSFAERLAVRWPETVLWATLGFVCAVVMRGQELANQHLAWNASIDVVRPWTDAFLDGALRMQFIAFATVNAVRTRTRRRRSDTCRKQARAPGPRSNPDPANDSRRTRCTATRLLSIPPSWRERVTKPRCWRSSKTAKARGRRVIDLACGCSSVQWLYAGGASAFDLDRQAGRLARALTSVMRFVFGFVVFAAWALAGAVVVSRIGSWLASILPGGPLVAGACALLGTSVLVPAQLAMAYFMSVRRMNRQWNRLKIGATGRLVMTVSLLTVPVPSVPVLRPAEVALIGVFSVLGLSLWNCASIAIGGSGLGPLGTLCLATFGWLGLCVFYRGLSRAEVGR